MPKITFRGGPDQQRVIDAKPGQTLLEIAEDGDDAWTLLAQFIELDRLRRTDVDALAARLLDLDQRIEVFRSNG